VIIALTCILAIVVIVFVLRIRPADIPPPDPVSPFQHLDERKAAIYENLRDLQFEYRVGKLSDEDYQATKRDLQKELAAVLAEVDKIRANPAAAPAPRAAAAQYDPKVCPHCHARFDKILKFCGECGKPMKAVKA
jgi:hypothetical protein